MAEPQTQSEQLSQRIEKDVRTLIGDLHMQVLVMRNMMEMQQQAQMQASSPSPMPTPEEPKVNGSRPPREVM